MSDLKLIPTEMLTLIPLYGGDKRLLNLFLRKCEYVINIYKGVDNPEQNIYVMHAVTSRLTGDAAALISQREDDLTWEELKALLIQRFGDHRTEESIAMELENIQIYHGESYIDFYNRIQSIKTLLLSKINQSKSSYKDLRVSMYTSKALDAFLYCLPEYLFSHVRQKKPETLEKALEIVVEELNFYEQYNLKNKGYNPHFQNVRPPRPHVFNSMQQSASIPTFGNANIQVASPYKAFGQTASVEQARPQGAGALFGMPSSTTGVGKSQLFGASSTNPPQWLSFGSSAKDSNPSNQVQNNAESKINV